MYICPKCKSKLNISSCTQCEFTIRWNERLPVFFTDSVVSKCYEKIGDFYDKLYGKMDNVWNNLAGRGYEFDRFISSFVMENHPTRYLDIGCGQGNMLAMVTAPEKFGIDISRKALLSALDRTYANLCLGFAEELPYQTDYFDAITSIGVMTHFINDYDATREILRVLRPEGIYVVGMFIPPVFIERILDKVHKFVYPRPRPIKFIRKVVRKVIHIVSVIRQTSNQRKDYQPIEKYYTSKEVEEIFKRVGFVISEMITKRKNPNAPLAGHHFRIYILRKKKDG